MKVKLKSMIRKPITTILLILLLGTISFGFVSKVVEYLVIDNAIEETSKYYKSIGYLTNKNPETSDVTEGARLLMESDEISFYEVLRRCTGTLDEIYNSDYNSRAGDMAQSNVAEILFWGDLVDMYFLSANPEKNVYKDTYTLKFHISDSVYGYPEYVSENSYLMINYYPDEENDSFAEIYDSLELNKIYGVKAYHGYQEGMVLRQVIDGETWFLTEDQTIEMQKIKEADAVQDTNRHRVWIWGVKDLSSIPNTQESLKTNYLIDGRWIDYEDNILSNPVCVIHKQFAETRNLSVGDTLQISLENDFLDDMYYPIGTEYERLSKEKTSINFTIVGIFSSMLSGGYYTSAAGLEIYIPDSCIPSSYDADRSELKDHTVSEGSYSFVLKNPELEKSFVQKYNEKLENAGYDLHMIENNWTGFSAAANPIKRSAMYSALIFLVAQITALIMAAYLYFNQQKKNFAIARALGISSKREICGHIFPVLIIGTLGIGSGGILGWKYALIQVQKTLYSLLEETSMVTIDLPVRILLFLIIASILILLGAIVLGFLILSKRSVLEILHGTQKQGKSHKSSSQRKDYEANTETAKCKTKEEKKTAALSSEKHLNNITTGTYKPRRTLRFHVYYLYRSKGSSVLMITLVIVFLLTLGWILQSIRQTGQNIENLYENIAVEVEVMQESAGLKIYPSYISENTIDAVINTGFVKESYLVAQSVGAFLDDTENEKSLSSFTLCGVNSAEMLNIDKVPGVTTYDSVTGEEIKEGNIQYLSGWDDSVFYEHYNETDEIPIIISNIMMQNFGKKLGDTLQLRIGAKKCSALIVGSYSGTFTNFSVEKGTAVLLPLECLKVLDPNTLYYSNAKFILDPSKNQELSSFREITTSLAKNDATSKSAIAFRIWDEELRMAAEPMEQNLHLMEILYPIAQIVAMLAGGMVSLLLLLQSAKRAAILRVLGIPAKTVRKMLGAEQLTLGVIGTILGILLCIILGKWNIELMFSIGLYLLGLLIGTMIGCILVTNKKPLELLQVKE